MQHATERFLFILFICVRVSFFFTRLLLWNVFNVLLNIATYCNSIMQQNVRKVVEVGTPFFRKQNIQQSMDSIVRELAQQIVIFVFMLKTMK